MSPKETKQQTLARVSRELGSGIRRQARARWAGVRTAHRNEGRRHVWRFRSDSGASEYFLHVPHESMVASENSVEILLMQLKSAGWLDRMQQGPETSFILSRSGALRPWSRPN